MNHKLFLVTAFLYASTGAFSQQDPVTTQFWNTYLYSNPATAGLFNRANISALYRNQWVGVTGAPVDFFVNGSARVDAIHGGVGLSYLHEEIGYNKSNTIMASYAFHFQLAPGKCLSVGAAAGIKQLSSGSWNWITPVTMNDPALPVGINKSAFDANAGIAYADSNFRAGFSVTNVNSPTLRSGSSFFKFVRHYVAFAEYDVHLGNKVVLTPRVGGLTDFNKVSVAASLMATINNRLWFGANFMSENSVGLMIGYDIFGKHRIGYSYDYTINKLYPYSKGTHEIVLAFTVR